MKVFIITGEPFPYGMAATKRIKCFAKAIIEGGIECEVIIFRRTERYGKVKNVITQGIDEGIPFIYTPRRTSRGKNRIIRRVVDVLDLMKAKKYLHDNIKQGDILFLYLAKPIEVIMPFMDIAHHKGAYCVRDLCELPYGTGTETELTIRFRKKTIEQQFPRLDGIISISDALLKMARTYTLPTCKHIKVPIMVDYNYYHLLDRSSETTTPYIFHAGTLYQQKDGILGMIEAFGKAIEKIAIPVNFIFTGTLSGSPHKDDIDCLVSKYGLEDRLFFTGYINSEVLQKYLSQASLVIINKNRNQQNNYCFSTKMGEYLAAGKPMIITRYGEAINWIKNGESAFIVEPEDTDELSSAIAYVFNNLTECRKVGLKGQEICRKNFDYRSWIGPIIDFFNQIGK